ncbi:MAG: hypothetical protein K2Y32_00445 [Candidatus Obscuribacterales bacterium]|nr:hypothetical protein [Candidatus Obscuribacterales bacterium]
MSAIDFGKYPPPGGVKPVQQSALRAVPQVGDLVKDVDGFAFGMVEAVGELGITVAWSNGEISVEPEKDLRVTTVNEYREALYQYGIAEACLTEEEIQKLEAAISVQALTQPLHNLKGCPLYSLEAELIKLAEQKQDAFAHIWNTPAPEATAADDDIFAALGVTVAHPEEGNVVVQPSEDHEGTFDVGIVENGKFNALEHFFGTEQEAKEAVPDWIEVCAENRAEPKQVESTAGSTASMCAICNNVKTNKNSPTLDDGRRICKKCQLTGTVTAEKPGEERVENFLPEPAPSNRAPLEVILQEDNLFALLSDTASDMDIGVLLDATASLLGKPWTPVLDEAVDYLRVAGRFEKIPQPADKAKQLDLAKAARRLALAWLWGEIRNYCKPEKDGQVAHELTFASLVWNKCKPTLEQVKKELGFQLGFDLKLAPAEQPAQPPTTYFMAFEGDRIWGVDKTREGLDAILTQLSQVADVSKIVIVPCTRALYHAVRSVGDNVSWAIVNDIATTVEVTREGVEVGQDAPPVEQQQAQQQEPVEQKQAQERTEAGLVDPETGEVIEPSFILQKFGWTELPVLRDGATKEQVDAFEQKLDQVVDRAYGHLEKAARYRAACEARCKPYDGAAQFYFEQFIQPMARMLAKYRLKTNKKGEFVGKTMTLPSGPVKFSQTGGAQIFDREKIVEHIKAKGFEAFKNINARPSVDFNSRTLLSLINKGALTDIPGTKVVPKDPLGKCSLAKLGGAQADDEGGDDE